MKDTKFYEAVLGGSVARGSSLVVSEGTNHEVLRRDPWEGREVCGIRIYGRRDLNEDPERRGVRRSPGKRIEEKSVECIADNPKCVARKEGNSIGI